TEATEPKAPGTVLSELQPGRRAYVRVRLEAPAVLTRGDRFILRQYSPALTPIRTAAGAARFALLNGRDVEAVAAFVEERRGAGVTIGALARRAGTTPAAAAALCAELSTAGSLMAVGGEVFSARLVAGLEQKLLAAVAEHHRANPMSEGLPR